MVRGHGAGKMLARILGKEAVPTQSELEDLVLDLILRGGFAHPYSRPTATG